MTSGPDPSALPVHLKAGVTVLIRPGEKLELMPDGKGGWRLFARTPKTKTWREIARTTGGAR